MNTIVLDIRRFFKKKAAVFSASRERDNPRLALNNIKAGVCERQEANRTREAGHLDETHGVVARFSRSVYQAIGFIV
jgi:hypothetical protein